MIRVSLSADYDYADSIMRRPEVWPFVSTPGRSPETFSLKEQPGFLLRVYRLGEPCGVFFFAFSGSPKVVEAHVMLTLTGSAAVTAAHAALAWVFRNTEVDDVVGFCLPHMKRARVYAALVGFRHLLQDGDFEFLVYTRNQFKEALSNGH